MTLDVVDAATFQIIKEIPLSARPNNISIGKDGRYVYVGIMQGEGELAKDGKTLNWEYVANCPREQKPVMLRQVETATSPTTKTLEMFVTDPKSGDEFKMMRIEFTKK